MGELDSWPAAGCVRLCVIRGHWQVARESGEGWKSEGTESNEMESDGMGVKR